jgi:hypothetical protein
LRELPEKAEEMLLSEGEIIVVDKMAGEDAN